MKNGEAVLLRHWERWGPRNANVEEKVEQIATCFCFISHVKGNHQLRKCRKRMTLNVGGERGNCVNVILKSKRVNRTFKESQEVSSADLKIRRIVSLLVLAIPTPFTCSRWASSWLHNGRVFVLALVLFLFAYLFCQVNTMKEDREARQLT